MNESGKEDCLLLNVIVLFVRNDRFCGFLKKYSVELWYKRID